MTRICMLGTFALESFDAEMVHFSSIASGLADLGQSVHIYHLSRRPAVRDLLAKIPIHETFVRGSTNNIAFILGILKTPQFIRHLRRTRPDILYVRLGIVGACHVLAARAVFGRHLRIITEHNGWIGPEARAAGRPAALVTLGTALQRHAARASNRVRAVSPGVADYLVKLGVPREIIFTAGNGTDTGHFRPLDIAPVYDLGFAGNLAVWQGLDWLLDAWTRVCHNRPASTLSIAGEGPEENHLKTRVNKLSLNENVHFPGAIPYAHMPEALAAMRICCAPKLAFASPGVTYSYSPLKIRDYAACGRPVIASRLPGLEEIDNFGLLVDPGDTDGLAAAILRLLEDPVLCRAMGGKARRYAEDHYAWTRVVEIIAGQMEDLQIRTGRLK